MIEDELLKLRFKAGSIDAMQRIYQEYRDYLLTLAMAMVNDSATAEDVVHDVFVSFAQSGARFRRHGSTCRNRSLDAAVADSVAGRKNGYEGKWQIPVEPAVHHAIIGGR